MAQTIRILRTAGNGKPTNVDAGELFYAYGSGGTYGKKLSIGHATTPGSSPEIIGGSFFTDMLDHTAGTLTANSAILVDANSKIDQLKTANLTIGSNVITAGSGNLQLNVVSGNLDVDAGTIDLSTQATGVSIKDAEAAAFDIKEGSTSYLKIVTTNSAEKIILGKDTIIDGNGSSGGVTISDGLIDIRTGTGSVAKIKFYCESGNLHAQTLQAAPHALSATNTLVLPATGTTLATQDGTETLTNKTLTSPDINTPDIDGGTIDGTAINSSSIGASTPSTGAFTAVTVDNVGIDGNTIQSTSGDLTLTAASNISVNSKRITNLATPVASTDAATKGYIDGVKQNLDIKDGVRLASTANVNINSALANGQSIDGVTIATGDRILLKDQTTASQNGIYIAPASGAASRSEDANVSADVTQGMFVFVAEGTANGANGFVLTTTGTITLNSTGLTFTQFSGAGSITAGDGLTTAGSNIFKVNTDDKSIEIDTDAVRIKGISQTANGDLIFGANGANGGYSRLALGTYDSTHSVGQILQVGSSNNITWTNTIDGGTY